jgi:hypothetical protein
MPLAAWRVAIPIILPIRDFSADFLAKSSGEMTF